MRRLALVLALACGRPALAAPARSPAPSDAALRDRRAAIEQQLDAVDHELDAIDAALAASDHVAGMSLRDALALVARRLTALYSAGNDALPSDPPPQLALELAAIEQARAHVADLEVSLGERNPELIAARQQVARAEKQFAAQRNAEEAELGAWQAELMHLPARATAAAVHDARIRVLRAMIAGAEHADALPSDIPAGLRLAFDERLAARDAYADLARDLGPKHPELIAARVRLDEATRALPAARDAALHELDAPPPRAVDISRRAELAARARALRAAYEAALSP